MINDSIKSRSNLVAAPLALGLALATPHLAFAQVDASNLVDVGADVATSVDAEAVDVGEGVQLDTEAQVEVEAKTRAKSAESEAKVQADAEVDTRVQTQTNVRNQVQANAEAKATEAKTAVSAGVSQATDAMAKKKASVTTGANAELSAVAKSEGGEALKIDLEQLDAATKEKIRSGKNVVVTGQFGAKDDGVSAATEAEAAGEGAVSATVLKGASASGADLLLINGKQKAQAAVDASADLTAAENAAVAAEDKAVDLKARAGTSVNSAASTGKKLAVGVGGLGVGLGTKVVTETGATVPRLATLSPKKINGGTVLSGGIGEEEEARMLDMKSNYNLRLTFSAESSGTYLADVLVNIEAEGQAQPLVNMVSTGPLFYADLPSGEYTVRATHNAKTNIYLVNLDGSASKDVILTW